MTLDSADGATPTFRFDLIPASGHLDLDANAWLRVQRLLCELQPAKRVTREVDPARISVTAYGDAADRITDYLLGRLEDVCAQDLRYVAI